MSEEIQKQPEPANHANEKTRLECEKLKAEIKAIHKPIFLSPSFYPAIAPVALAIVGLIFTWSSGWFDVQRTRISNEKILLEAENKHLLAQKESLTSETAKLEISRISLNSDIERLNQRRLQEQQNITLATNELYQLQRQSVEKEQLIQTLNSQVSTLTKENKELQPIVSQLNKLQVERDQAEKQNFEVRKRLANAYSTSRDLILEFGEAAATLGHPEKLNDTYKTVTAFTVSVGKWRGAYDADLDRFNLREFTENTNTSQQASPAK